MSDSVSSEANSADTRRSVLGEILDNVAADAVDRGLSEAAADDLLSRVVEKGLPRIVSHMVASLHKSKPELLAGLAQDRQALEAQIQSEYSAAFANYEAATHIAFELAADSHERYVASGTADQFLPACQALFLLHGRALTVSAEVLHLLRGGYGDGAGARYRTLHEITVVVNLLGGEAGDELAARYLDYATIERYQDMVTYQKHCAAIGYRPFSDEEVADAKRQHDEMVERHGPRFAVRNQWAAPLFPTAKNISFVMLEEKAGIGHKRPFYMMANHHVHAGPRAAIMNLRRVRYRSAIGVGARSGENIAETAHGTLIHLLGCTASLIVHLNKVMEPDLDTVVGLESLQLFVEHSGKAFERSSARLSD